MTDSTLAGLVHHILRVGQKLEGQPVHTTVHEDVRSGGKPSSLEVLKTTVVALTGSAAEFWGSHAFEIDIRLVTGRTHQVC